ncbi:MAG TPA: alpha/beta fold hydrolase [Acidimicrobiia bacterium]|nr:alpha/beta fold hydrolase [Acidimicrobiia bacterium]
MRRLVSTSRGNLSVESIGEGPDLILLHSLLTDKDAFDPIIPLLSERWRITKVGLPGFDGSTRCEANIDAFADSIGALLEAEGFDPDTTTLLGNGFGGFVALGTAVRHGDLFDRMVLIGCGTGFSPEAARVFETMSSKVAGEGMASIVDIALGRIFTGAYLADHPGEAEARRQVLLKTDPESFIIAARALQSVDYSAEAATVQNPTLIVVGSEDQATPPAMGEDLARRMPSATFRLLPGLAHAPQLQDPAALVEAIRFP